MAYQAACSLSLSTFGQDCEVHRPPQEARPPQLARTGLPHQSFSAHPCFPFALGTCAGDPSFIDSLAMSAAQRSGMNRMLALARPVEASTAYRRHLLEHEVCALNGPSPGRQMEHVEKDGDSGALDIDDDMGALARKELSELETIVRSIDSHRDDFVTLGSRVRLARLDRPRHLARRFLEGQS